LAAIFLDPFSPAFSYPPVILDGRVLEHPPDIRFVFPSPIPLPVSQTVAFAVVQTKRLSGATPQDLRNNIFNAATDGDNFFKELIASFSALELDRPGGSVQQIERRALRPVSGQTRHPAKFEIFATGRRRVSLFGARILRLSTELVESVLYDTHVMLWNVEALHKVRFARNHCWEVVEGLEHVAEHPLHQH
jgi:hypothetical protein